MRMALVAGVVWSTLSFADVPGPKTHCDAPAGCVSCEVGDSECIATAQDAGLVLGTCYDGPGTPRGHLCPPGHPAVATCGCGAIDGMAAVALLMVLPALRRRR